MRGAIKKNGNFCNQAPQRKGGERGVGLPPGFPGAKRKLVLQKMILEIFLLPTQTNHENNMKNIK